MPFILGPFFLVALPALNGHKDCSLFFSIHGDQTTGKQKIQGKHILLFKMFKMFHQDREYFRCRFRPALFIPFLLFSPTEDHSRNELLKLVQKELIYVKDFLHKQNEEQWKQVNTAKMVNDIERLMKKLSD